MNKKYILLFFVILLASFLRLWQLGSVPSGVHADEANQGYTVFSLLKTGVDLSGKFNVFGLTDTNTGGTYPPIYSYVLMPLVNFFGLSISVVRFPSAAFGIISVFLVFLVSRKLFGSYYLSLIAALLFALNPWAIHISRQALGESISLFTVLSGITFFLYSDKNKYLLFLSSLVFGLSLYSYDAPKVFLPLFIPLLVYFYWDKIKKFRKAISISAVIFAIFYLSIFFGSVSDYKNESIFGSVSENVDIERTLTTAPLWESSIFHNKFSVSLKRLETSYSTIFSVNWLFVNGSGNLQHSVGNHGEFYLFELPFFFIGMYLAFKKNTKLGFFLLGWMLIGALPGAVTATGNFVYRSVHVLPVPILFSSLGIVWFVKILRKSKDIVKYPVGALFILFSLIYVCSYLFTYFFDYPVYASEYWAKQQNSAILYVEKNKSNYANVFVDGGQPWATTYAYFYKVDPTYYQRAVGNKTMYKGIDVIKIDNMYFGDFNLSEISTPSAFFPKDSMIITNSTNFSNQKFIESFKDPGGVRDIFKVFIVR